MLEPAPAPSSTRTWCPAAVSSRAPSGVSATRYSLSLTSLGTPTITVWPFPRPGCGKRTRPGDDAGVASDRLDRVHEPGARHALELVFPAFGEHDARAGDEVGHRAGDQHLVGARERRHAGADVDRDAAYVLAGDLHLTRVQAGSDLQPEVADTFARRDRAPDRARGTVERREEAVPRGVDLAPAPPGELSTYHFVVSVEDRSPCPIPQPGRRLGRGHHVGEQHRREHAVRIGAPADTREELLDLVEEGIDVAGPHEVILARELHEPRPRDPVADVAPLVRLHVGVVRPVEQERRDPDRRQNVAYVDLRVHTHERGRSLRAGRLTEVSSDPTLEGLVPLLAR